jgi:anthraniloyl-CoA monooxygenase
MNILCFGGGPASLYFAILMMKRDPAHRITVLERGPRDATWGFGVVFSDETLRGFLDADAPSYKRIVEEFAYWDKIETRIGGEAITSGGHGFCGMSRLTLLNILHDRCDELGVELKFNTDITDLAQLQAQDYDLVIAGDGLASMVREAWREEFGTTVDLRQNKFCWLATTAPVENFTFIFHKNQHGWWWAHAYRYQPGMATWIVECSEETWLAAGMDKASEDDTRRYCEELFAADLQGHPLVVNRSIWRTFPVIRNERLCYRNMVLLGDSGRSAHFSIGSGTKLAMEDAITLAACFDKCGADVPAALAEYQAVRKPEADRLQRTAVTSLSWFEHIDRYAAVQAPQQFTFNMMVRSKRVTYDNLRLRDPRYIEELTRWFAARVRAETGFDDVDTDNALPPMFLPMRIGSLRVENRVQMSAMCQYCADEGAPDEWHLVHYGSRAVGGVGMINSEMLCVAPDARITTGCAGIWNAQQTAGWKRIVDFIHGNSKAVVCAQLGHAGRKGATCVPWQGDGVDQPLESGEWPLISASPIPYLPHSRVPREATRADMDRVRAEFASAAANAAAAGFDMIELHLAHGYLLSSFISPCTNQRADEYGGSIDNRLRYPLEVVAAVREVWPAPRPLSVRLSATDWVEGGLSTADLLRAAQLLKQAGVDVINVSTGQVVDEQDPVYGRMYQAPFADLIRNEVGIATIVAGNITSADQCNTLIAAGRTDMVALARPLLADPHFTLAAAARYGHREQFWPPQYLSAKAASYARARTEEQEQRELRLAAKPPAPTEALAVAIARGELLQ